MRTLFATTAALAVAGPACAQDIKLTPLIDGRVRYEHVDQDGIARDADALTVRVRGGVQATSGPWSTLIEAQGTLAAIDDYYDGVQGAATRPLVADPENVALYRGAPQGLSYGQRQSEQMVNKSLSVAAKYIKFRGFVRLDELEVTGSPLVMFHPRSS